MNQGNSMGDFKRYGVKKVIDATMSASKKLRAAADNLEKIAARMERDQDLEAASDVVMAIVEIPSTCRLDLEVLTKRPVRTHQEMERHQVRHNVKPLPSGGIHLYCIRTFSPIFDLVLKLIANLINHQPKRKHHR